MLVVSVCRECAGCQCSWCQCVGSVRGVGVQGVYGVSVFVVSVCRECTRCQCSVFVVSVCRECTGCQCSWCQCVGSVRGVGARGVSL